MIKFEKDECDYKLFIGDEYIGLICTRHNINTLVIDGRGIGTADKLWKAKITLIWKYSLTRIFGL